MIDNNKIEEYKNTMAWNSYGAAKIVGTCFSNILNLPSHITEEEFKHGIEYSKALQKMQIEENSAQLSEDDKNRMKDKVDIQVEILSNVLKEILKQRGNLLRNI